MKIVTIIGARPQFVKASMVSLAIQEYNQSSSSKVKEIIIHTGQHFDPNMSEIFFDQMKIPEPHYNLGINSLSHGAMTGQMLEQIERILLEVSPDWVLVYGDTNSTLAGALAAKKLHIKVAHVEAGLRSFNINMPEEINRILTDRISDLLFCPTTSAKKNLQNEGFDVFDARIVSTGDIMLDAAMVYRDASKKPESIPEGDFVLCTVHRAENTDSKESMRSIFSALEKIAGKRNVVLPLHPRTREFLRGYDIQPNESITLIEPVGYMEMLWLLSHCTMVITDSGGLQKEAFFFKKPCITIREETEWVELIEAGVNTLAGAQESKILNAFNKYMTQSLDFSSALYGTGNTRKSILNSILQEWV